jgi:hypothetical protein
MKWFLAGMAYMALWWAAWTYIPEWDAMFYGMVALAHTTAALAISLGAVLRGMAPR